MRKTTFLLWLFVIILLVNMAISSGVCQKEAPPEKDFYKEIELFANTLSVVQSEYADEVEPKKLIYGALEGMISSLDPHSQFLEPDSYKEIKIETQGEFGGIGIEISIKDGLLTIVSPIEGTPAAKAGIMAGDKIVRIDGKSTKDITLQEAVKRLRGKPGARVELIILREEEKKLFDFKITRAIIKIESIKEAKISDEKDKIGYIKLVQFQEKTAQELDGALKRLKSQGMRSLILDLRNNPGGLLDSAVNVAERFVPEGGVIVSTKGRVAGQTMIFKSKGKNALGGMPMVVLVNKGSASASEILAGCIQDLSLGIILGTKTFGKASVQTVVPLSDGSALRLTTARYYTPNNHMIHGEGIMPDITVEKQEIAAKEEEDIFETLENIEPRGKETKIKPDKESDKQPYDNQFARAVDLLKGINVYSGFLKQQGKETKNAKE